jgi:predicted HicB family RNase H-like nuclease
LSVKEGNSLRVVRIPKTVRAELHDAAYLQRVSMSERVRQIITDYAAGTPITAAEEETVNIRFVIGDDVWARASERARAEKTSLSAVVKEQG